MINTKSLSFIAVRRQLQATGKAHVATATVYITEYVEALKECGITVTWKYLGGSVWELSALSTTITDEERWPEFLAG